MLKRYLIYGLMGWSLEIIWTGLDSLIHGDFRLMGFTNLWMFFIYGSAAILEPLHDLISGWRWPLRGLVWLTAIWGIEYFSGLFLLKILGVYPWRYTDPLAINGLITLSYAPVWFIGGLLFERVHRKLDAFVILTNRYSER
ncbi:MAG: hypothetical protein FNP40_15660 [Dehalobacter sp. 4CP]|nr:MULTISPECIES: membrane protein [unclassified Dehalobacter]MCM1564775.1 putative ABC transporter permease [Dehalobacter sp.]NBJ16957.1 hypothetical protein [Dehalobacter sp. 4CP]